MIPILKLINLNRLESELIMRARMARRYQLKEAARRTRDWQRRDVWITKLPNPAAPLL